MTVRCGTISSVPVDMMRLPHPSKTRGGLPSRFPQRQLNCCLGATVDRESSFPPNRQSFEQHILVMRVV